MRTLIVLAAFILMSSAVMYQAVRVDSTLTGSGTDADPIGVDTSEIATQYDISGKIAVAGTPTSLADGENAFSIDASFPSVVTGTSYGVDFQVTGAGTSAYTTRAFGATYNAGYTGSSQTAGISGVNKSAGTGTTMANSTCNLGLVGVASGTTVGTNLGLQGVALNGDISCGLNGRAVTVKTGADNIGVSGYGYNTSGTQAGGIFSLGNTDPTFESGALICDNGSTTDPIFLARDNGTTVFSVLDGGGVTIKTQTPASAGASGTTGQVAWDASYIYICTATNTWKRVAIATW